MTGREKDRDQLTSGLTLDAGALIAIERDHRWTTQLVEDVINEGHSIAVPVGALAQVWRGGGRQARLARILALEAVEIEVLDDLRAHAAGQLCGARGTADVIDASVVLCARSRGHRVVTSDPDDLARLDPRLPLIVV